MLHDLYTRAVVGVIISGMAYTTTYERGKKIVPLPARGTKTTYYPDSDPVVLAVCGDPIVGRALVLLLRKSRYDAKFLSTLSLREPGALQGIRLLLLIPALDSRCQKALSEALENEPEGIAKISVLKLVASSGRGQEEKVPEELGHKVPWPCSTEELKQRIEAVLFADFSRSSPPR